MTIELGAPDGRVLRRYLRDLAALTALPAVWRGAERDRIVAGLQQAGYCYGRRGQVGAQMSWHRCGLDSLR